jgi:hypothetical protein
MLLLLTTTNLNNKLCGFQLVWCYDTKLHGIKVSDDHLKHLNTAHSQGGASPGGRVCLPAQTTNNFFVAVSQFVQTTLLLTPFKYWHILTLHTIE